MAKPLIYNATITERVDLTPSLAIFAVRPEEPFKGNGAWFVPGQYLAIGLNNERIPELGSVRRAMSIASAAQRQDAAEFYVRYVSEPESDNPLTHLLWETNVGDGMYMRPRPTGKFTLESTVGVADPRLRILVAAGTGLAPFMSMVRSAVWDDPNADLSRFVILHGVSYPADLGYCDELLALGDKNRLFYYPTVSRPKEAPEWKGDAGRVEHFFDPSRLDELEERLGLGRGGFASSNVVVYVCGLQGTISQSIIHLARRGFIPEDRKIRKALQIPKELPSTLFYEQYDTEPVIEIGDEALVSRLRREILAALDR